MNEKINNVMAIKMLRGGMTTDEINFYTKLSTQKIGNLKFLVKLVRELKREGFSSDDICSTLGLSKEEFDAVFHDVVISGVNGKKVNRHEDNLQLKVIETDPIIKELEQQIDPVCKKNPIKGKTRVLRREFTRFSRRK